MNTQALRTIPILFLLLCLSMLAQAQLEGTVRRNLLSSSSYDGGSYLIIQDQQGKMVPGTMPAKEKPGHIAISGFTQLSEAGQQDAEATGPQIGELRINKSVGENSAVLLEAMLEKQVLRQVDVVTYSKKADGSETEEFRMRLENARVVSVQLRMKPGSARLPNATLVEEELVLEFDAITWIFDDGTSSVRMQR
jgi:type VI secretion system Hcp family effector